MWQLLPEEWGLEAKTRDENVTDNMVEAAGSQEGSAGPGEGAGAGSTGPHLRGTWSGCRAPSSPRRSPSGRRTRSWARRGLAFPRGLRSSTSGTSVEGQTGLSAGARSCGPGLPFGLGKGGGRAGTGAPGA